MLKTVFCAALTPEPPTPAMLESVAAANSSLTELASSAPSGEGRLTRARGSVSGNLAALGRPEGSAQASNPSITDAAAKLLSGTAHMPANPPPSHLTHKRRADAAAVAAEQLLSEWSQGSGLTLRTQLLMPGLCIPAGKRKVTIEEIREALRKACAEATERDPEGVQQAASFAGAAPAAKQTTKGRVRQQKAPLVAKPKKATPARKAGHLDKIRSSCLLEIKRLCLKRR